VSWGLPDVLELESLGGPAVLVACSAFAEAAKREAALLGQPALAGVFVAFPAKDRTDDEMRARGRR
jgi:hypothetical protein